MSFSLQGVSRLNTQIEQVRTDLNMRDRSCKSPNDVLSHSMRGTQQGFTNDACYASGVLSKPELNASIVTNTLDRLNKDQPWQNNRNAMQDTYNLTKDVVGAYVDIRM